MLMKLVAAAITLASLSACAGELGGPPPAPVAGGTYSSSVGFTGIGYHPTPRIVPVHVGTVVYVGDKSTVVAKRRY